MSESVTTSAPITNPWKVVAPPVPTPPSGSSTPSEQEEEPKPTLPNAKTQRTVVPTISYAKATIIKDATPAVKVQAVSLPKGVSLVAKPERAERTERSQSNKRFSKSTHAYPHKRDGARPVSKSRRLPKPQAPHTELSGHFASYDSIPEFKPRVVPELKPLAREFALAQEFVPSFGSSSAGGAAGSETENVSRETGASEAGDVSSAEESVANADESAGQTEETPGVSVVEAEAGVEDENVTESVDENASESVDAVAEPVEAAAEPVEVVEVAEEVSTEEAAEKVAEEEAQEESKKVTEEVAVDAEPAPKAEPAVNEPAAESESELAETLSVQEESKAEVSTEEQGEENVSQTEDQAERDVPSSADVVADAVSESIAESSAETAVESPAESSAETASEPREEPTSDAGHLDTKQEQASTTTSDDSDHESADSQSPASSTMPEEVDENSKARTENTSKQVSATPITGLTHRLVSLSAWVAHLPFFLTTSLLDRVKQSLAKSWLVHTLWGQQPQNASD